jgi:hypothetical protein
MEKKFIKEADGVHEKWYEEARGQTLDTLPVFLKGLMDEYSHDEVTLTHAVTAGAMATISAMDAHPEGGLTPSQNQLVFGLFLRKWARIEGPAKVMSWAGLLNPKNEDQMVGVPKDVAHWISGLAKQALDNAKFQGQEQKDHLEKLAKGEMPWGFRTLP